MLASSGWISPGNIITLHAWTRGKVIGFVCYLSVVVVTCSMKIATLRHPGIWETLKPSDVSEWAKRMTFLVFKTLGNVHESCKSYISIGHSYQPINHTYCQCFWLKLINDLLSLWNAWYQLWTIQIMHFYWLFYQLIFIQYTCFNVTY